MNHHTSMMLGMITSAHSPLIVAVSGGVDSVSLLHMLVQKGESLIVAHVNHGIRSDSDQDEAFVRELANSYQQPFVSTRLKLPSRTSEETARHARYAWLEKVAAEHNSTMIATAHHQDDVLETIVINLIRGTGWRGLCSLRSTPRRYRPLLIISKAEVVKYAIEEQLQWREDSTNNNFRYLRNRIRHQIVPKLSASQRSQLVSLYTAQVSLKHEISNEVEMCIDKQAKDKSVHRYLVIMASQPVATEILRTWLGEPLEAIRMSDLLLFAKVARLGDRWSLDGSRYIIADKTRLIVLMPRD